MSEPDRPWRWRLAIELAICTLLVAAISVNAMRRMDYFGTTTEQQIRMTDESRTAYVAKNLAEGHGYTTNDLPASLVDFYDLHGKLHAAHWVNADRFPFAAYLTAAIYTVTGSTSWKVGILGYNLVFFIAFLVVFYAFSRAVWRDPYASLFTVTLALLHAYTFQFLYWKDGDTLLLTTLTMWALYRYFKRPDAMTWKHALAVGTLFAFLFLARPNFGAALILAFLYVTGKAMWRARGDGAKGLARRFARREWLALGVGFLWCVPFMIYSLGEWGTPLFSANSLYQLPLGTRFAMGTDTWWKYTEPGHPVTLGRLFHASPAQLWAKFPTSWGATLQTIIGSYPVELALACGALVWLGRRVGPDDEAGRRIAEVRPLRPVAAFIGFALVSNLALLPLYGYQHQSYRHYLCFILPLVWLCAGGGLALLCEHARPHLRSAANHVRAHAVLYLLGALLAVVAWNCGAPSAANTNRFFTRTSKLVHHHWLVVALALGLALAHRWVLRPPWWPRVVVLACGLVLVAYRPNRSMKETNFVWFPANDQVWGALRQHHGLVSSLALQGEVAWNTDRLNIPAPEWPMEIYSLLFDHKLEVEDLYIESADAQVTIGPFKTAAAGFEGYARLQHYRTMPGYEVAYHYETTRGYPKFRIKAQPKASTVFHLADRGAVQQIAHSPTSIDLGDPAEVIYTAHGWGEYYALDGKQAVAGTDVTRERYLTDDEGPWEDASVTFFLDERRPTSLDLEIYAPAAASYTFYWNLDLYEWDRPEDRAAHALGTYTAAAPGWQRVHLAIPPGLTRKGLNKLGFRSSMLQAAVMCPAQLTDVACLAGGQHLHDAIEQREKSRSYHYEGKWSDTTILLRPAGQQTVQTLWLSLLAGELDFQYSP